MFHIHIPRKILVLAFVLAILMPTVAAVAATAPTVSAAPNSVSEDRSSGGLDSTGAGPGNDYWNEANNS